MARIEARLYATLRKHRPEGTGGRHVSYDVAEGTTVRRFLERQLQVDPAQVKVVFVNGCAVGMEDDLTDGDRLDIFPPVAGG